MADLEELIENLRSTPGEVALRSLDTMHTSKTDPLDVADLLERSPPEYTDQFCAAVLACLPEVPTYQPALQTVPEAAKEDSPTYALSGGEWHSLSIGAAFCTLALRPRRRARGAANRDASADGDAAPVAVAVGAPPGEQTLALAMRLHDALPLAPRVLCAPLLRALEQLLTAGGEPAVALACHALPALLRAALDGDGRDTSTRGAARAADVKRVHAARAPLSTLDLRRGGAHDALRTQLLRCASAPLFLRVAEGQLFLAFMLTLPSLRAGVFDAILNALAIVRKSQAACLGKVFLLAWRAKGADRFRATLINLIEKALFASSEPLATNLRIVLSAFHSNKRLQNMDAMLCRVYGPTLLPNLLVANPFVRRNAVAILCSAYPIHDPNASRQQLEAGIHTQTDKLIALLEDPQPLVRIATVHGVCRILANLVAIVPQQKATKMVDIITSKCACDSSSAAVRIASFQGLKLMLENHETYPLLSMALPRLRPFIHDNVERVRIAILELLVKLKSKHIAKLSYLSVVPLDQILLRLPVDSPPVVSLIMQLIVTSYFPVEKRDKSQAEIAKSQFRACIAMLRDSPRAAETFYKLLYLYVPPNRLVDFSMTVASKAIDMAEKKSALKEEAPTLPPSPQRRKMRTSKRQQSQKKRVRTALVSENTMENKENDSGQPSSGQLMAVAADVLQSITPFLSKDKELSRKLREYVNRVFDATSLKPYLVLRKYSRPTRSASWRIASCLAPSKAKPLYAIWQQELRSTGKELHTLTKEVDKLESFNVFVSLISCGLIWKRYKTLRSVFEHWADQIENPTFSALASALNEKKKKGKAGKKKGKQKSDGPEFQESTGSSSLTIGLTAIVVSVDALTDDADLRQKYLFMLKELELQKRSDSLDKSAEDSPIEVQKLVSAVLRGCQSAVGRIFEETDGKHSGTKMHELALSALSAAWRLLSVAMAENYGDVLAEDLSSFLKWSSNPAFFDTERVSSAVHADFVASFAAVTLAHCADAISLGALPDDAIHLVEGFIRSSCGAMRGNSRTCITHFVANVMRIANQLSEHAVYADAVHEMAKDDTERPQVSRAPILLDVRDVVLRAILELLASMELDEDDAESSAHALSRQPMLVQALGDVVGSLDVERAPSVLSDALAIAFAPDNPGENVFAAMLSFVYRRHFSKSEGAWNSAAGSRLTQVSFGALFDNGHAGSAARFSSFLAQHVLVEDGPLEGDRFVDAYAAIVGCLRPLVDCLPSNADNEAVAIDQDNNNDSEYIAEAREEVSKMEVRLQRLRSGEEEAPSKKRVADEVEKQDENDAET